MAVPDGPDHGLSGLVFTAGYLLSEFDLQITFFGREGLAVLCRVGLAFVLQARWR
jgi:hypothetical protein